jgi:hypothetical protein
MSEIADIYAEGDPFVEWNEANAANDDGEAVLAAERQAEAGGLPGPPSLVLDEETEFDVRRVIDVSAANPVEAARKALCIQRDPAAMAGVFIVTELGVGGAQWRVDLDDPESGAEVLRDRDEGRLIAGTGLDFATGPGSPDAALARIRALRDALAEARAALAGDSNDAEHEALYGLAEAAAAFTGEGE